MRQFRQGDVLLFEVNKIPSGAEKSKSKKLILAEGEVTGHAHAITSMACALYLSGNKRYLQVLEPAILEHEEHGPITIPDGTFEVVIQREYTPEEIRNVAD
jgi:hypothetical protein